MSVKVGDKVLYVLPDGKSKGEERPAFVVKVWSPETVNLQVLTDGSNDDIQYSGLMKWVTSVTRDPDRKPGTWH